MKIPPGWEKTKCPLTGYYCALVCVTGDQVGLYDCRGLARCRYRNELKIRRKDEKRTVKTAQ